MTHVYLSTACLHGIHDHCQARSNLQGEPKVPAVCKWCSAPCVCECHGPMLVSSAAFTVPTDDPAEPRYMETLDADERGGH